MVEYLQSSISPLWCTDTKSDPIHIHPSNNHRRRTLAHTLWARRTNPQADTLLLLRPRPPPTPVQSHTRPRPARRTQGAKYRRRRRGEIIMTGSHMISHTHTERGHTYASLPALMNRKRSAQSVAIQVSSLRKTDQQQLPTKKRRRLDTEGKQR